MTGRWGRRGSGAAVGLVVAAVAALAAGCTAPTPSTTVKVAAVSDSAVNDARYQCLLDHGFPVTRTADGSVKFSDPEDKQTAAYTAASQDCERTLADKGLVQASSPDQLRTEYVVLSGLHQCLADHGFALVTWPSETVYVEKQGAFNVLSATAPVDDAKARAACGDDFAKVDRL